LRAARYNEFAKSPAELVGAATDDVAAGPVRRPGVEHAPQFRRALRRRFSRVWLREDVDAR
jgi:hypothetical protein